MGKRYVIGDIHGHLDKLKECLSLVNFDRENDLLISVGDLCDRGPDSRGVVEELMTIKNLIAIRGNHDEWFYEYLNSGYKEYMWFVQGGKETLDSYNDNPDDLIKHKDFYAKQIPYYVIDNMCFVHGGFDREYPIEEQDASTLCWDRNLVEQMMSCKSDQKLQTADDFYHIFIGHTPTIYWYENIPGIGKQKIMTPITRGGITNIDTGCGKGGKLTIMDIDTKEYKQSI